MMRRLRAKGFGPFPGSDGLTPRERRNLGSLWATRWDILSKRLSPADATLLADKIARGRIL